MINCVICNIKFSRYSSKYGISFDPYTILGCTNQKCVNANYFGLIFLNEKMVGCNLIIENGTYVPSNASKTERDNKLLSKKSYKFISNIHYSGGIINILDEIILSSDNYRYKFNSNLENISYDYLNSLKELFDKLIKKIKLINILD